MHRPDESPAAPGPFRAAREGRLASRRGFLGAGAAALGLAVTGCAAPSPRQPRRMRLELRPPSGPYPVGTVSLHLVDHSRRDPSGQRYPIVLYSPGYQDDRALGTGLVSDLASRGYVVLAADYTYEAAEVQFPGGRVEVARQTNLPGAVKVRIADTRFVLDQLAVIVSGLPTPGDQASFALVKHLGGTVAKRIGDRPFMIMTHAGHSPRDDVTLEGFWANLTGWRLLLTLSHSGHYSYTDDEEFLSQLVQAGIVPPSRASRVITPVIGTIDPARAVAAERAYLGAFFDLHLRHRASSLLDRPSPQYPDIQFTATRPPGTPPAG